jgi:Holliday junction DNA helicase RuvB
VRGKKTIDREEADYALGRLQVDSRGLDEMDRRILNMIIHQFGGGPVGVNSLAVAVSEETETIEDVYEPFLIQEGLLQRTSRGRVATERALKHLGLTRSGDDGTQRLL